MIDAAALRDLRAGILDLKCQVAALRFDLLMRRLAHDRALKANFNPNQPRVPAGVPEGGQWTEAGWGGRPRSTATDLSSVKRPKSSSNQNSSDRPRLRITVRPRGIGDNRGPALERTPPPEIPDQRPSDPRLRNAIIKQVAKWIARSALRLPLGPTGAALVAFEAAYWLHQEYSNIQAYQDTSKSLDELHDLVSTPASGYQVHHIVEQTHAAYDGFPQSLIHGRDNRVRVPTLKHREITGWYMRPNKDLGGQSPRDYLRGKSWEERRRVGIKALRDHGVLKP